MQIKVRLPRLALSLFLLLCSASMWLYWSRLPDTVYALTKDTIRAKALTDLYPRWYGTRELLLHHRDPYGVEVSREIQTAFYGRVLDPSRPEEPRDQQRFAYPLYVVFLLAPTVDMSFHTVRIVFWWFLAAVTLLSALFWLRFFRLHLSLPVLAALAMLLTSIPVWQGVSILQLALLVSCFLSAAALSIASGQLFLAGSLLALATIKPQLSALPIAWLALWVSGDWRRRRSLLWGFAATFAALVLGSEYLLPGWLLRYPGALRAYAVYTSTTSLLGVAFPSTLAWLVSISALVIAGSFWWSERRQPANSRAFAIALCFALTLTVAIVPAVVAPYNHVLLLPVVLLMILHWKDLWLTNPITRFACAIFCGCGFLPWLLAFATAFVPSTLNKSWLLWSAPLSASLALPFAAFGSLLLMRYSVASSSSASTDTDRTAKGLTIG
jgi:hypothetical protein